jgi:hypothetical protein
MLVGSLVGYHLLLLSFFGPYVIIFINVCVVSNIDMVCDHLLLRDFGLYGILL